MTRPKKNLLNKNQSHFMDLNLSNVVYSKHDLKRKIKIPTKLTPMLAEDLGFHIGDGCMIEYRRKDTGGMRYQFNYSGNLNKDFNYFQNKLLPRKKKLYNLDLKVKIHTTENSIYVSYYSRVLYDFFLALDIPSGKKTKVSLPEIIKKSPKRIKAAFIRGLAAADFCVCVKNRSNGIYPSIKFVTASKILCKDVCKILQEFRIPLTRYEEFKIDKRFKQPTTTYCLDINGRKRLNLWMQRIGFSDKRNLISVTKFSRARRDLNP